MSRIRSLEGAYIGHDDPMGQSGFSGGRERWVAERSPLTGAIDRSGDFLDVGCANGLLASDVVAWAAEGGYEIVPHGLDIGPRLIELARERHLAYAGNFVVSDAWKWEPERRWTYVYSLLDYSPEALWCKWLERLLGWVEPGGRLIVGSYGSRSRLIAPAAVSEVLQGCGISVDGSAAGGEPAVTRFAWTRRRTKTDSLRRSAAGGVGVS